MFPKTTVALILSKSTEKNEIMILTKSVDIGDYRARFESMDRSSWLTRSPTPRIAAPFVL
jgi:hypothetical protein